MSTSQPAYNPLQQTLHGAYCELAELTSARFAATDWLLRSATRARAPLLGSVRSTLRGRGLEFEEARAYQAGDDVRTIDWRVTARSGRPFTKLFREEREKPLLIVVDQRQPMFFGSRHCFKSKLAAYLAALLAWSGLEQGDRIGGLIIGNRERREIRPRRTRKTAMAWLNALLAFNRALQRDTQLSTADALPSAEQSLLATLSDLRHIAKPGSTIYIISDFCGSEHPQVREHLYALARHCDITALFIFDPLERELPPPALYAVTDGNARVILDSGDKKLREYHRAAFDQHLQQVRQLLQALAIPLLEISTAEPPLQRLTQQRGAR
ncbi:MAG TPA: DUF58 domain-containing protein [Spongiibacteraceae bacterium]|jgi:uncharacterized protein (DUF58 family)